MGRVEGKVALVAGAGGGAGGGSSIINVTLQLAEVARPERAAYVASKGDGRSLTHAMALETGVARHSGQRDRPRSDADRAHPRQLCRP